MTRERRETGALGEKAARRFLQRKGYAIIESNCRLGAGEIDIVARDGDCLAFVEVRTKRGLQFGTPAESIDRTKRAKLIELGESYLQEHPEAGENWRIDVVAVELDRADGVSRIELIRNAVS